MPFSDNLTLFKARLAANLPQATLSSQSVIMGLAQAFLSADADTQALLSASVPDMFLGSATGAALDRKAADYGVRRGGGSPATVALTFSLTQPAATLVTIPLGTPVSTPGDGLVSQPVVFRTTHDATIAATHSSVTGVMATATSTGVAGNVAAHTVTVPLVALLGGAVSVDNPNSASGGLDADSDTQVRAAALMAMGAKYAPGTLAAAVLSVSGTFDAYVVDPQDGGGYVTVYWADVTGAQPGLVGSGTSWSIPQTTPPSLAARVHQALVSVLPPNILPRYQSFSVRSVTASATYSAPAALDSTTLGPQIQSAMVTFINGLGHGQAVGAYALMQSVGQALNFIVQSFVPQISPVSAMDQTLTDPTVLYRYTGDPSTIVLVRQ